jgi:protein SCO1
MKTFRIVVILLAVFMAGLFAILCLSMSSERQLLASQPFGEPFQLTRQDGQPITEAAFKGKPTALFFGFTHCPEICPTTVYELTGWMNTVDPDKSKLQAYFVSIDPSRDTPALLGEYLSNASDRIIGISGDPKKVEAMARSFKVYFKKVPADSNNPDGPEYTMDHTASVFLLDAQGHFTGTIAYGENEETAVQKLRNLMGKSAT